MTRSTTTPLRTAGRLVPAALGAAILAATAVLGVTVHPAAAATGPTCGAVVTASLTLQSDLSNCPGDGLRIGAAEIAIDLNGHTISASPFSSGGVGVRDAGFAHVTIKNGFVNNFATGVVLDHASSSTVSGLGLKADLTGITVSAATGDAVTGNTLEARSGATSGDGIVADGANHSVQNNTVSGFPGAGISLTGDSPSVANNLVDGTGTGIRLWAQHAQVYVNTVTNSSNTGIAVQPMQCDGSVCVAGGGGSLTANSVSGSGADGIRVPARTATVYLARNVATDNAGHGINGSPTVVDAGYNRASGNHLDPQCIYVAC